MLKSASIPVFIILFTLSLLAQVPEIKGISDLVSSRNKPLTSKIIGNKDRPDGVKSSHYTLPSDGTSTSNASAPVGTYRYEREVYLITQTEMTTVGIPRGINFTDIAWTYDTPGSSAVTGSLKIYLQNTSDITNQKGTNWSTNISTMVLVDNKSSFTNPAGYYLDDTLSNPTAFTYTGGGLYIAFDYSNPSNSLSTGTSVNTTINLTNGSKAGQSNSSSSPTIGNSNYRPETYLGYTIINDAQVTQVYTLGKLPIPYATPHKVAAVIQNGGDNDLNNLKVKLNVTGTNAFADSIIISTLVSGFNQIITFSAWTPTVTGVDTIKVSVPPDVINSNNTITIIQLTTPNIYSYAYGPFPASADGGVGLTGTTGDFVAKFNTSSPASVSQVGVNFTNSGQPYKIGIWDATGTGGTPGTVLWQSGSLTSTVGISTILVNPKVNVSGKFYVGVRQTGTINLGFAYQSEVTIRDSIFYFAFPTGATNWTDFASTSNTFRLMIEPGLTLANDVGPMTIDFPQGGTYNNLAVNIAPKVTIANFGSNNQSSPFNTTMKIYNASSSLVYTSTKSLTLNAGTSQQVTFDATFNPTAQMYTVKCYTSLGSDGNNNNDTLTASLNYSQFSLNLTALIQGFFDGTTMVSDTVTVELRDTTAPYNLEASKKVVLSSTGNGIINNFTTSLNNISPYYIVVKHRNSIETWSASGNIFNPSTLTYDFTSSVTQAYGNNMGVKNGKYCLYSGDVNQDGHINLTDLIAVDNDNAKIVRGYLNTDVNGDTNINLNDLIIVDNCNSAIVKKITPP